ncbi:MAG: discoidin domain-containing protein [Acidimicrobiales bacterium]|nr:discoidin domain-containing protein [Acidimicrobiales bacterium]
MTPDEAVSMPQDLLRMAGTSSAHDPLTFVMTRLRGSGYPPRGDYELNLARVFWMPTARSFDLTGQVRLSPQASDQTLAGVLGRTGTGSDPVVSATSSSRLTGNVEDGALAAIDGDPGTAWQTAFGPTNQAGAYVQYQLAAPLTVRSMALQVLADGRHSVPTQVTVSAGGTDETVRLPDITDRSQPGSVVDVPVTLPQPVTGSTLRVTVDHVRTETTTDDTTLAQDVLPVGIAELGIPGLVGPATPALVPSTCRSDLLTMDGAPVWVSLHGSSAAALDRQPLGVSLCGPDAGGLNLSAGNHTLRSVAGSATGIDVDQLALASAPGGGAAPVSAGGQLTSIPSTSTPRATVSQPSSTAMTVQLSGISSTTKPFELVLGQSINQGWQATAAGYSLGTPDLIDGFANGWRVDPADLASGIHDGRLTVVLHWAPQGGVNLAVVISAAALIVCVVLAFGVTVRRRRRGGAAEDGAPEPRSTSSSSPNGRVGHEPESEADAPLLGPEARPEAPVG